MTNFLIYDAEGNLKYKSDADSITAVQAILYKKFGDDAVNFDIVEDESWSDVPELTAETDKPDVSKMTQKELHDLTVQIEGGDTGRSFEESAKYWADQDNQDRADLFTAMANRWWDLEEESHAVETKPITIRDLEFHTLVTDGTDYAVVEITTETEMGKYYAHVEPEFIDDSETAILVSDMDTDYFEDEGHVETKPVENKIRNVNPAYGDPVEFDNVDEMAMSIELCGYELPEDGLIEGRDYEVIAEK